MNRNSLAAIVVVAVVVIGGLFYFTQQSEEAAEGTAANVVAEINEATQKAIDFCTEKGGTVEVVNAAEGTTHLCAMADGTKAEVSQYMADNQ